jgi:hypothetical protein
MTELPVVQNRCNHFTTLATMTSQVSATPRHLSHTAGSIPTYQTFNTCGPMFNSNPPFSAKQTCRRDSQWNNDRAYREGIQGQRVNRCG